MAISITKNFPQKVITHGGIFHSDDVIATVILSKVFGNITVLRTFKIPDIISDDVIVYDIGLGKFDHHQKGGNGVRENGVPYASSGLIWKEYGHKLVESTSNPEFIWKTIDRELIQGVDATDNGAMPRGENTIPCMSICGAISSFNPTWDSSEDSDEAFLRAVKFAETIFDNVMASAISKANAQSLVTEAIENSSDGIMVLKQFAPWQNIVFHSKNPKANDILFVVFPSKRGGYNWQCVPNTPGGFDQRKPVPSSWKGLNGFELQNETGVSTATFCHAAGFIGGAETMEDAIALAKIAVNAKNDD